MQGYFESRHFFVVRVSMFSTSLLPTFFMRFSWCQTAKSTRGKFVVAFIYLQSLLYSCHHNEIIKFQLLTTFILQPSLPVELLCLAKNLKVSIVECQFSTLFPWKCIQQWQNKVRYLMSSFICSTS